MPDGQFNFRVTTGGGVLTRDVNVRITAHQTTCTNFDQTFPFTSGTSATTAATTVKNAMSGFSTSRSGASLFVFGIDKVDSGSSNDALRVTLGGSEGVNRDEDDLPVPKKLKNSYRQELVRSSQPRDGALRIVAGGFYAVEDPTQDGVALFLGRGRFYSVQDAAQAMASVAADLRYAGWTVLDGPGGTFTPFYGPEGVSVTSILSTPIYDTAQETDDHWIMYIEETNIER